MTSQEIFNSIGKLIAFAKNDQNEEATALAFELLEVKEVQEDLDSLAKIYNTLGILFYNLSNYSKALEYYEKGLRTNETTNYKQGIANSLGNIGIIYRQLSDYTTAFEYYKKALSINEELGSKEGIAINLGNIGLVYSLIPDLPKALEYYQQSLHIYEEIDKKNAIALTLGNIGIVYKNLTNSPKALEYLQKALLINTEIDYKIGIAYNYANIGTVYQDMSEFSTSLSYLNKTLEILKETKNEFLRMNSLGIIADIYEKLGNIDKAYSFFRQHITLKEEIQSEETHNKSLLFDQQRKIEEDERARQLKLARFQEQERIFHNILPVSIANRLIEGEQTIAESFEKVSIFFSDIVGFTTLSSKVEPAELVKGLNTIFTAFDRIGTKYGLEKIKTIGDAYMAVCGVPQKFTDHAKRAANFALEANEVLKNLEVSDDFKHLQFRIGLHCGGVVAGIIGEKKFAYDVWGDAVNVASRMESHSESGRIHISEDFAKSIESIPEFSVISRGEISIKGKGIMKTFWLEKAK